MDYINRFVNILFPLPECLRVKATSRSAAEPVPLFVTTDTPLFHSASFTSILCSRKRTYAQRTEEAPNNRIISATVSPRNAVRPPRKRTLEFPNEKRWWLCPDVFTFYLVCFFCIYDSILWTDVCTGFWWGNLRERDQWGDPDADGRIILRSIFRKWEWVVGTGWSRLRIGTGGGHLWVRWWTFGFQKCGEFLD